MPKFTKGNRAYVGATGQGKSTLSTDLPERYALDALDAMDKRGRVAKSLAGIVSAIYSDLGGKENVSVMQQMICEKIAYFQLMTAKTELIMAQGGSIDEASYLNAINCLSGLLSKIGLKRKARQLSLKDYLHASKTPEPAPASQAPSPTTEEDSK